MSPLLQAALAYAARGWAVLPLEPKGKVPLGRLVPHGLKDAATDPATVRTWWDVEPLANVGVKPPEGVLVLDVDGDEGRRSLADLERELGTLPVTATAATGGGGEHRWFAIPEALGVTARAGWRPGLDLRPGSKSYLVAPPSVHPNGAPYSWTADPTTTPTAEMPPGWLAALPTRAPRPPASAPLPRQPRSTGSRHEAAGSRHDLAPYLAAALDGEARRVRDAPHGEGNATVNESAFALGTLSAHGLSEADARRAISDGLSSWSWSRPGDEAAIWRTFESGWKAGISSPRPAPERPSPSRGVGRLPPPPTDADAPPWLDLEDIDGDTAPAGPQETPTVGVSASDLAHGAAFVEDHGADLRWCYQRRRWFAWDGRRWDWEAEGTVERRAQGTAWGLLRQATATMDEGVIKRAASIANLARQKAMTETARSRLEARVNELDRNPWLLTVSNGTIDLRTGRLQPHRREDMITKIAPVDFDSAADCPRWTRFLEEILVNDRLEPDHDLISFVQRAIGYTLTGETGEQCLFLLIGPQGRNGKSVLLGVLEGLLGDLATSLGFATLLADKRGRNKGPELLPLLGARLATANEPDAGQRLDEALVKSLTGEDRISVNPKYETVFSFSSKAKLWLACNQPPHLAHGGGSMARRLRVIPFRRTFNATEADPALATKLQAELPGILAWAVRGCLAWQRDGLGAPPAVTVAGEDYRCEADPLAGWLEAYVSASPGCSTPMAEAAASFKAWAEGEGRHPIGSRRLAGLLRGAGYTVERGAKSKTLICDVVITPTTGTPTPTGGGAYPHFPADHICEGLR